MGRRPSVTEGMTEAEKDWYWRQRQVVYSQIRKAVMMRDTKGIAYKKMPLPDEAQKAEILAKTKQKMAGLLGQRRKGAAALQALREPTQQMIDRWRGHGCKLCGEREKCCLDAHHIGAKKADISRLVRKGNVDRLHEELQHCICVCANCHRKIHAGKIDLVALGITS